MEVLTFAIQAGSESRGNSWNNLYGEKHRWKRLDTFPAGLQAPRKVRIYQRNGHFLLNFWDPQAGKNLSERVEGDLLGVLIRARTIEERLINFRTAGMPKRSHLGHVELVEAFIKDLHRRANAGEIVGKTVIRYTNALRHYLAFCEQTSIAAKYKNATRIDREFRLGLLAYLEQLQVTGNGRKRGNTRRMKSMRFVTDTVRAMLEWASDPHRGGQMPEGFRNPFLGTNEPRTMLKGDPLAEPDITLAMAASLLETSDAFQLRLFVPMLLFGLRAEEPRFLFREYVGGGWLRVPCNRDLDVRTKGRLDKRFPLVEELATFWKFWLGTSSHGLLFPRRRVFEGKERPPLEGNSLDAIVAHYQDLCRKENATTVPLRLQIRDQVLHEAGAITYDGIDVEFRAITGRLGWSSKATLKDLRHLFATTMHNAAMPEAYRRYLMGQSLGKSSIVAYTHLNELKRHFGEAVNKEWGSVTETLLRRVYQVSTGG